METRPEGPRGPIRPTRLPAFSAAPTEPLHGGNAIVSESMRERVPPPTGLRIGAACVEPPLVLAPMAGITTPPFRLLCRRAGAGLVCGQLVSAQALAYRNVRTERLLETLSGEHPVSLQLFGRDVGLLRDAVPLLAEAGADIIDLNAGCAVRKVLKAGAGAALLREPALLGEIVRALVAASPVPVTVKIRAGFREGDDFVEVGRRIEDAGASAISIHARPAVAAGRGRNRRRGGPLAWDVIRAVKDAVAIPVIGNGGVRSADDARRMFRQTSCDAVMIGRGALGRPWLFRHIADELWGGGRRLAVDARAKVACALWHAQALALAVGERSAIRAMRTHGTHYIRGMPGAAALRGRICQAASLREVRDLLCEHVARLQ